MIKVNFIKDLYEKHEFREWFIVEAFANLDKKAQDRYMKKYEESDQYLELEFKVNGEEIDPFKIIDEMNRQFEAMVLIKARDLIDAKINEDYAILDMSRDNCKQIRHTLYTKLGIKHDEDE